MSEDSQGATPPDPRAVWRARVGARVVVRYRSGGALHDALGVLESVDDGQLRVVPDRTGRGPVVVPLAAVVAGKVVPPRPVRAAPPHRAIGVVALQRVASRHWAASEQAWLGGVEGGWLLRAHEGFTGRANSALPCGDPGLRPARALASAAAWYADRGLVPTVTVPADPADPGDPAVGRLDELRAACVAAGWRVRPRASSLVLVAATGELRGPVDLPAGLHVHVLPEPDEAWLAGYRYRGGVPPPPALALLRSAPEQGFVGVLDGRGRALGLARVSLADGWAGLVAVHVDETWRRRGLGTALLRAAAGWAWARGALSTFLQVEAGNAVARTAYERAGFVVHHRYDYYEHGSFEHGS